MASGELVDSILGGTGPNYVGHMACIPGLSAGARKERKHVDMEDLARGKELADCQERNRLHRAMSNGVWFSAVPHRLNGT